ncbi:SH3 domain-containing protein [Streptomyces sp. NPDC059247]|uniref:SH3 domain-containing protein n=1 Tax=Streptomyces sp. NPDC059247 TaxID=3346790 RepID=UPI0036BD0A1E
MGTDENTTVRTATVAQVTATAAAATRYALAPGFRVNVRSGPSTQHPVVRQLAAGSTVAISCQKNGESVTGPYGTSRIWDAIGSGEYVSDSYVHTGSNGFVAPRCA